MKIKVIVPNGTVVGVSKNKMFCSKWCKYANGAYCDLFENKPSRIYDDVEEEWARLDACIHAEKQMKKLRGLR